MDVDKSMPMCFIIVSVWGEKGVKIENEKNFDK